MLLPRLKWTVRRPHPPAITSKKIGVVPTRLTQAEEVFRERFVASVLDGQQRIIKWEWFQITVANLIVIV